MPSIIGLSICMTLPEPGRGGVAGRVLERVRRRWTGGPRWSAWDGPSDVASRSNSGR